MSKVMNVNNINNNSDANLSDLFIRKLLIRDSSFLTSNEIPKKLVELKREQILTSRKLKKMKNIDREIALINCVKVLIKVLILELDYIKAKIQNPKAISHLTPFFSSKLFSCFHKDGINDFESLFNSDINLNKEFKKISNALLNINRRFEN